jgi:DNA polymerase III subunit beta
VIPTANSRIAILATKDLETSVRRVPQFADERGQGVKLTLQDNALKIASKSTETVESEEVLETVYSKESVVIGFNASYCSTYSRRSAARARFAWSSKTAPAARFFDLKSPILSTRLSAF